jgi:hypothetical protein
MVRLRNQGNGPHKRNSGALPRRRYEEGGFLEPLSSVGMGPVASEGGEGGSTGTGSRWAM